MNRQKVALLSVFAALTVPAWGLSAQIVSKIEAGQYSVTQGALPTSMLRLAPTVQFELPYAKLRAKGSAFLSEQQLQLADGIVSGTFTSPTVYGVHAEMIGNASRAFDSRSLGTDQVDVQTRVALRFRERGGAWLGGGVARPWRVGVVSSADVTDAGAWTRMGGPTAKAGQATMTLTFTNFSFTKVASVQDTGSASLSCAAGPLPPLGVTSAANMSLHALFSESVGTGSCERQSRFSDLEGSMHWEVGAFEITAATGYRFGDSYDVTPDSRRWTTAAATIWLSDRVAVIAGGGRQPALPLRGLPARSFGMAGLELAYWPISRGPPPVSVPHAVLVKTFEVRSGAAGLQKIIVHVGGVETVDVMGDFSDWAPLVMARKGRDLWELSVPMAPGTHQINVRVDGGQWMAPPGMPMIHNSFGGDVGQIVVHAPPSSPNS